MRNLKICWPGFSSAMLVLVVCFSKHGIAHGNGPGPNGGVIQMPGSFHTELLTTEHGVKIFLLDMNFKNPTVKNSEVKVDWNRLKTSVALDCKKESDHFVCPSKEPLITGQLQVKAMRDKIKGGLAIYPLPLK
jgi:hypothetical protein